MWLYLKRAIAMRQDFFPTLTEFSAVGNTAQDLGAPMLQCYGLLVPEIAPEIQLLIVNFPRPIITFNEPADFNLAGGAQFHTSGAPKNRYDGQIQVIETESGQVTAFAELLMACGGMTNCVMYDGERGRYTQAHELRDCAITFEPLEIDAEGVSTVQRASGAIKYNYYGINANLGTSSSTGVISGLNASSKKLLDRASSLLNVIYAGNSIIKAMRDLT